MNNERISWPKDFKPYADIPKNAGNVVSMCVYKDMLFVACENGVYKMRRGKLVPVRFEEEKQEAV